MGQKSLTNKNIVHCIIDTLIQNDIIEQHEMFQMKKGLERLNQGQLSAIFDLILKLESESTCVEFDDISNNDDTIELVPGQLIEWGTPKHTGRIIDVLESSVLASIDKTKENVLVPFDQLLVTHSFDSETGTLVNLSTGAPAEPLKIEPVKNIPDVALVTAKLPTPKTNGQFSLGERVSYWDHGKQFFGTVVDQRQGNSYGIKVDGNSVTQVKVFWSLSRAPVEAKPVPASTPVVASSVADKGDLVSSLAKKLPC